MTSHTTTTSNLIKNGQSLNGRSSKDDAGTGKDDLRHQREAHREVQALPGALLRTEPSPAGRHSGALPCSECSCASWPLLAQEA